MRDLTLEADDVPPDIRRICKRKAYAANQRRRAQMSDGQWSDVTPTPKLTWQVVFDVMTLSRGKCCWCGANVGIEGTLEHVKRIADGGTNDRSNLAWACLPCNRKGYYR
jgi:hypothetical protein